MDGYSGRKMVVSPVERHHLLLIAVAAVAMPENIEVLRKVMATPKNREE